MTSNNATLITIITEAALETTLIKDIEDLGAPGYSISNARGKGSRGVRDAAWEANSNIRMEIICSDAVANKIMEHLEQKYYQNYAMVCFSAAVSVLRPQKFN